MKKVVPISLLVLSALFCHLASATDSKQLVVELTLPSFNVAEYHKPYVAIWLEDDSKNSTQLALWYDQDMRDDEGTKWLKDIRQWWRRVGRSSSAPYDGLTSATNGPGTHSLTFQLDSNQLQQLSQNTYQLRIEAAREVGGRELVSIPLSWPPKNSEFPLTASGSSEIESVKINLK